MIRTIDKYVAREFLRLFSLASLAVPVLFILGDWTEKIEEYTDRRLTLAEIGLGYVYQLPLFLTYSIPIATLIATVFTVNNMTRHAEMTAAKAGGLSFFRALRVLPVLGIALTALAVFLTELVPLGTMRTKEVLREVEPISDMMRHDFVYAGDDGLVYTIRRLVMSGPTIGGISIERREADGTYTQIMAREAAYDSTGRWLLRHGVSRLFDAAGNEQAFTFRDMHLAALTQTPEQLMARAKEPEEMRYTELGEFIETLERSGATPLKLKVERAQKFAIPAATLVIILFGAPLANSSGRGGAAYGIGVSLGVTIIYLLLFKVMGALGNTGTLSPDLAAWLPNIIFLLAAVILLWRVRT
ncbi:MAG TPA: LptF/LptG family permease [Longimicrobiales bacterium]|nr:LptF/LptG family permease [Longimicrobiales bacterium]